MAVVAKGKYGYFDPDKKEYVITRPDTPRPWVNYMMNDSYVAMISNTGGGVSYDTDPRVFRILRYRYQNLPYDRPGRYVYVRDNETNKYWSATWAPVHMLVKKCDYTCRVGTGYQVITMKYNGIRTEITYFVPPVGKQEIWDLKISNESRKTRKLSTYSYAEFAFWGALRDLFNIDNTPNISLQEYHADIGAIAHHSYNDVGTGLHDMRFVQHYGFHVSTPKCTGHNGDRDRFIGNYRDEKNPVVVEKGRSTNYCENSGYPIGSLEHRFTLKPGAVKRIIYRTGMWPEKKGWKKEAKLYADPKTVDRAFAELLKEWEGRLARFQVKTPDKNFDAVVNSFVQYQSAVTMRLSRSISPYEWGIGRSIGFRDSSQDQMGMLHAFPELGRKMLGYIISAIYEDGQACHNFNPITNEWSYHGFYDDHNWPALTVHQYIRETGDEGFLKEVLPFAQSKKKASVLEHLVRAQNFAWKKRGKHGLMQTGAADWNDSLNPGDRETESMFTSALYCASTNALIDLGKLAGLPGTKLNTWKKRRDTIKRKMNTIGWDGGWYKRMIKTNDVVLGSKKSRGYARIFIEPQPWAVFAGIAAGKRAVTALDNVEKYLGTKYGHKVMDKPFTKLDLEGIGSATVVLPGIKENGSVFNHASSWMITAESIIGRGDKAFEYFMRKAGTTKNKYAETYEVEPYVSCQFISQPPFHIVGRGRNQWLTGSASWIALGAMQGIIGCRPDFDGLVIAPAIPKKWREFELVREYRGVRYEITVKNPNGVQKGVREMTVDGKRLRGNKIPYDPSKKKVVVTVVMG